MNKQSRTHRRPLVPVKKHWNGGTESDVLSPRGYSTAMDVLN